MNFISSLHIEHFIDVEIFLAIGHEVMFMRDEDFPAWKLSKLGDPTGGGRVGRLTLIISVGGGGGGWNLLLLSGRGMQGNFEPHLTHFPTPSPFPLPVINAQSLNPSVLIGSFLVGILPYRPFPWKRSKPCIFLFR